MDLSVLPTLYALTVFVCCFRPLVRRAGPHTNIWFVGWAVLVVHYLAVLLPEWHGLRGDLRELAGTWSVQICGLLFMAAASDARVVQIKQILLAEIAAPALLQAALYAFHVDSFPLRLTATLLLLIPAVHLMSFPRHRVGSFNHVAGAFAFLAIGMAPLSKNHPMLILVITLCGIYLSAAYLTFTYAPRITRGVGLMIGGLACWALSFPLQATGLLPPEIHLSRAILDLPRYLVAAGMILSFLDEYVGRAESLALHDPLTGLPNRRLFDNRLQQAVEEARQTRTPVACLVIDVDNFKYINDTHGHPVGDGLLRALAKRLSWNLGPRDLLARTGGDEFTALVVEAADEYHVRFIAGAMMASGCVPVSIQHHSIDVRISVGIAISAEDGGDSEELHKSADDAMYLAKRRGGGVVVFAWEEAAQLRTV